MCAFGICCDTRRDRIAAPSLEDSGSCFKTYVKIKKEDVAMAISSFFILDIVIIRR